MKKVDGGKIRQIREEKGIAPEVLAAAADRSTRWLARLELGEKSVRVTLNQAKAIAKKIGVQVDDIAKGGNS